MNSYKCPECPAGTVQLKARPGRVGGYRHFSDLPIPPDFEIPTCDTCGEEFVTRDTTQRLDVVLEPLYRERMRSIAVDAIEDMVRHGIQQQRIESQLGIARGYLSKIKSGDRVPSPELSLHLALIGLDPAARLAETEDVITGGFEAAKAQYQFSKANSASQTSALPKSALASSLREALLARLASSPSSAVPIAVDDVQAALNSGKASPHQWEPTPKPIPKQTKRASLAA